MSERHDFAWKSALLVLTGLLLTACGGTKVLKEPIPQPTDTVLASVQDERMHVDLQWVIVRDGPGTWSRPADWEHHQVFEAVVLHAR